MRFRRDAMWSGLRGGILGWDEGWKERKAGFVGGLGGYD